MLNRRRLFQIGAGIGIGIITDRENVVLAQLQESSPPGRRERLTIAVSAISNRGTLTTLNEPNNNGQSTLYSVFDPLIELARHGDLSIQPGLAESWQRIDDQTLEISLRRDVKFHDGSDFTAEDVVFSFEAQGFVGNEDDVSVPPEAAAMAKLIFPALESVEAVDDYTVRFTNERPDLILEQRLSRYGAEPFSKAAFLAADDYESWARRPVGTGPFKVAEFDPDTRLLLQAHEEYWGGRPNVDEIEFLVVPETASRVNGILSREYDLITDLPPDQIDTIGESTGLEVVGDAIDAQLFLQFVKNDTPLEDPRVRQALSHSIDRQLIVDTLWGGRTFVPQGRQFDSYGDMFIEDWANPEYDPDVARRLLDEAGYDGWTIPFRVMNDYYPLQVATAQVLVDMWAEVGLNVEIEMKENWTQVHDPSEPRGIHSWSNAAQFGDPLGSFLVQQGPGGVVRSNDEWSNDEFDALSETLLYGADAAERKAAFRRMLEIAEFEDPSYMMLSQLGLFYGRADGVDWSPSANRSLDFRSGNLGFSD